MGFVVGLTGGIGSGKTAVSDRFAARGVTVADADVASRRVVEPGTLALAEIEAHFGTGILNSDGTLDRAALRQIVFSSANRRKWLEGVTVPAIMRELTRILSASTSRYNLLVLSSGGGRSPLAQRNLVVDVPVEVQIERVTRRDRNTPEQVKAIMAAQPSRDHRLAYADDVIVNDGSLDALEGQVEHLHQRYLKMAEDYE